MSGYPRSVERQLHVERVAVEGTCEACGGNELEAYPVLSEGGWFQVVKCPGCLVSSSRERWSRLGPIAMLEDSL